MDPSHLAGQLELAIAGLKQPALLDPGTDPLPLEPGQYILEPRGAAALLHAWDRDRSAAYLITAITRPPKGPARLHVRGLWGKEKRIELADAAAAQFRDRALRAVRSTYAEQLRSTLARQHPGWTLEALTSGADLENSLSPQYPRAFVRSGATGQAAILAPHNSAVEGVLSFGLIWLDHVRRAEPRTAIAGLTLFLPEDQLATTALRLTCLDRSRVTPRLCAYDPEGNDREADLADTGNVLSVLARSWRDPAPPVRRPAASAPPPELALERQVRRHLPSIDARLMPDPVYGQVPAFAAADRDLLDLLAADRDGRLAVLELKASEDIHLPLQGLDYWLRVKWHAAQGEFSRRGYFPGHALRKDPPRLYFVAPALEFHPSNEAVLRYLSPAIPIERVGVGQQWRHEFQVVARWTLKNQNEHSRPGTASDYPSQSQRSAGAG